MAVTITLGAVNLDVDTCFVRSGGLDLSRLAEGRVGLAIEMSGATRDAAESVRRTLEVELTQARLIARSAAGPLDDSARIRLAINFDQTDTSYLTVYDGGWDRLLYSDVYPAMVGQLILVTDPYVHGATTEQTVSGTLTNGNGSTVLYTSIPGDLPALVRAQVHDLSSAGAINRIRLSTFGRTGMVAADIDTVMTLPLASGASTVASANTINATNHARRSITAGAAAVTVAEGTIPAELSRGPLDIWVRNQGASATLPVVDAPSLAALAWNAARQVAYGTAASGTTVSPSFGQDTLTGSTIVLMIAMAAVTRPTVTTGLTLPWALAGSTSTTNVRAYQYRLEDAEIMIADTLTTDQASMAHCWTLLEFDKVPAGSFDRAVSVITAGSGTSIVSGTTDPIRQIYEHVVAQVQWHDTVSNTHTWPASWTERSDQADTYAASNFVGMAVATLPTTAREQISVTATASGSVSQRTSIVSTYRAAGGLTAGTYAVKLVAVNIDGSKSAATAADTQVVTAGQAITVTITNGTATAYYEVWWQRDGGQWYMQRTDGPTSSYTLYLEIGTPGTPPAAAVYNTLFLRLAYGLRSASVLSYTDWFRMHPSAVGWGFPWQGTRTTSRPITITLAPSPTITAKPAEDWYLAVQAYSPDVTGNADVDGVWLAHHGSPFFESWYQASDGAELGLASRAIWDFDRRHDARHSAVLQGTRTLTASGNEITDAVRTTATQGDGTAAETTVGVWPAATNLVTNGGMETNTTGWVADGSTLTRVTTQYKFGAGSLNVVTNNAAANEGGYHAFTGVAATQYAVSAWVRGTGGTVRIALYDNVTGKQASSAVTLTSTWQRITKTATTGGGAATFRVYLETDTQQSITYQADGVQVETGELATPYVQTDGGTATRSAARVRVPVAATDETTFSWVVRLRMDHANTARASGTAMVLNWQDDASNLIQLRYDYTNDRWEFQRRNGAGTVTVTAADTFAAGDLVTLAITGSATDMGLSVDGAARTMDTGTQRIPTLAATTVDVGSTDGTASHLAGSILWVMAATTELTDANIATMHGYGDTDPQRIDLDQGWTPTLLWDAAAATSAGTAADVGQARCRGDLLVEPGNALLTINAEVGSGVSNCETCKYLVRLWTTPRFTRLIGDV